MTEKLWTPPGAKLAYDPNEPDPRQVARGLENVPELAEHFKISRSEARRIVCQGGCPCGHPGANPCWRVGGEACCAVLA